jgi:hypothetical protein
MSGRFGKKPCDSTESSLVREMSRGAEESTVRKRSSMWGRVEGGQFWEKDDYLEVRCQMYTCQQPLLSQLPMSPNGVRNPPPPKPGSECGTQLLTI